MNEKGAPSPVAWTRLRAPQGSMDPTPDDADRGGRRRVPAARQVPSARRPAPPTRCSPSRSCSSRPHSAAQQQAAQARELDAMQKQAMKDAERQAREDLAEQKRRHARRSRRRRDATRDAERQAERLRKQTVNAGVKIARVLVGKLFGAHAASSRSPPACRGSVITQAATASANASATAKTTIAQDGAVLEPVRAAGVGAEELGDPDRLADDLGLHGQRRRDRREVARAGRSCRASGTGACPRRRATSSWVTDSGAWPT